MIMFTSLLHGANVKLYMLQYGNLQP